MGEDSRRFRARAKQCRDLANGARDANSRQTLSEMAGELEEEAQRIEADELNDSAVKNETDRL